MINTKRIGLILVILGLILLAFSVHFILNAEDSNKILLVYGLGTAMYTLGFYLRIKI